MPQFAVSTHFTKPTSSSKIYLPNIYTDTLNFLLLTCYFILIIDEVCACDLWTSLDANAKRTTIGIQTLYQQFQSLPNSYRLKSTSWSIFFITFINQIIFHEKNKITPKTTKQTTIRLVDSLKFHTYHLSNLLVLHYINIYIYIYIFL